MEKLYIFLRRIFLVFISVLLFVNCFFMFSLNYVEASSEKESLITSLSNSGNAQLSF